MLDFFENVFLQDAHTGFKKSLDNVVNAHTNTTVMHQQEGADKINVFS